jgi:S-adenosyl-L-methionine hydrolase (adenosine-forming)
MKIITFTTDFGINSNYPAQMKAVALSLAPDAKLIDITHSISNHNILEGAYFLQTTVPYFPEGTVHVAVVDPGVGSNRRAIIVATKTQILIGPDNGLLIPVAKKLFPFQVYEIKNQKFMLKKISNNFHGRDIFTPVAAHILNGVLFEEIGPIIHDYIDLKLEQAEITDKYATGKILFIDDFGNIITNIQTQHILQKFLEPGKKFMVFIGKTRKEIPFAKTYTDVKKAALLITNSSSGYLEISANQSKASEILNVKPGEEIKILFG